MKTVLLAGCLLFATAAFGQAVGGSSISAEPTVIEFRSHDRQATQHDMGRPENVMEESPTIVEHGTRPLWEVAPPHHEIPLGDIARALREEHAVAKKSKVVWTN